MYPMMSIGIRIPISSTKLASTFFTPKDRCNCICDKLIFPQNGLQYMTNKKNKDSSVKKKTSGIVKIVALSILIKKIPNTIKVHLTRRIAE